MGYLTLRNIWISLLLVTQSYFTACDTSPKQARVEVINKGYRYTKNGFIESIKRSDHSSTALFILAGMNPNSISSGYSALEHAASDSISLPMILRAGADPNITGGVTTPLIEAIKNGFTKNIDLLIKNGADPNGRDAVGSTPLMIASECGALDIVEMLIGEGAQVNYITDLGTTALSMAKASGHSAIARKLETLGAQSNSNPDFDHNNFY